VAVCASTAAGFVSPPLSLVVDSEFLLAREIFKRMILLENQFLTKAFGRWIELSIFNGGGLFESACSFKIAAIRN
jgi:hypothetical protein